MNRHLITLTLACASLAPALTINFELPAYSIVNPPASSDTINLTLDNSNPLGPHFAQWILIYYIDAMITGPSAPGDVFFAEFVTGLPASSVLIQPGGTLLLGTGVFLANPTAVAGLHNFSFEVFFDVFDVDPIDPMTGDLDPNILAVFSNTYPLIYADLNVTVDPGSGVPEPGSAVLVATAALAGLWYRRRR